MMTNLLSYFSGTYPGGTRITPGVQCNDHLACWPCYCIYSDHAVNFKGSGGLAIFGGFWKIEVIHQNFQRDALDNLC